MTPDDNLRGYLFETYHERGFELWALSANVDPFDLEHLVDVPIEDLSEVKGRDQFLAEVGYLAVPPGLGIGSPLRIIFDNMTTYIPFTIIPYLLKTTEKGATILEADTLRQLTFTYFELINAIEKLPVVNKLNPDSRG